MSRVLGFIGSGNMGQAMIGGVIKAKLFSGREIIVSDRDQSKLEAVEKEYQVQTTADSRELVQKADLIVLAVKPNVYNPVLAAVKDVLTADKILITIAAGVTIAAVEAVAGKNVKIVRTMPNMPALVNAGMSALCANNSVSAEELGLVKTIYESFGQAEIIPESLIDSVIGISSSSPAYAFMFIEALADAGVLGGMPRDKAYKFAAQALLGSAKMVLETGKHPGELKDMVCSPGGTTIAAVAKLEGAGFRAAIIGAVVDCMRKSREM